jgi:hypothetical protein
MAKPRVPKSSPPARMLGRRTQASKPGTRGSGSPPPRGGGAYRGKLTSPSPRNQAANRGRAA